MTRRAYLGAAVFDGDLLHRGQACLVAENTFHGIVAPDDVPAGFEPVHLDGGTLLPGFVDLQVNGGGDVMFNDQPTLAGVRQIADAHRATGTRALLPTLITDTPEKTRAALSAVEQAVAQGMPGIVGLHLEGPHLSVARKGAHDPALIRPMTSDDLAMLCAAAARLPNLMVTVAPETVTPAQIAALNAAGVIVSLGHSDATLAQAQAAVDAGARCFTHLFNAMSGLASREPGMVGAALTQPGVAAGLIADGIHVHPTAMALALSAKPTGVFLVTDAMATLGSDSSGFQLNGRQVSRRDGRLTLADGTLAGADLDMPTAISVLCGPVGLDRARALSMATSVPAGVLRDAMGFGRFVAGQPWQGIYLNRAGQLEF